MGSKVNEKFGMVASKKIRHVANTLKLGEEDLGKYLRHNGIFKVELEQWKDQMRSGLENEQDMPGETRKAFRNKIKQLEKELKEAQAIIEVQKKVQALLAEKEKSTPKKLEKK